MHAVGVGRDIDKAPLAEFVEPPLLRFDHVLILDKGRRDLAIELFGRLGLILAIPVRDRPEVIAARLGLRRQPVKQPELEPEIALRVGVFAAGIGRAGPLQDRARRDELEDLAAIDAALKSRCLDIARRGHRVFHPSREFEPRRRAGRLHLRADMRRRVAADRLGVQIAEMRQVHQIVDHQHVIAFDRIHVVLVRPGRLVVVIGEIDDQ